MTWLACLLFALAPTDGVSEALARLRAPTAAERALGERWLGVHLVAADLELVVAAIETADAEVTGRLVEALGSSDRHLGLTARLAARPSERCRAAGQAALRESIARFDPGASATPLVGAEVLGILRGKDRSGRAVVVDATSSAASLGDFVELLARAVPSLPALVLDPDVDARAPCTRLADLQATSDVLIERLADAHGLELEGHGLGPDAPAGSARWIRLARARPDAGSAAAHLLAAWCVTVESAPGPAARVAAARALASTAWPGASAWLAERALAGDDAAALEGAALAAARGQVPQAFFARAAQDELRAAQASALARADARSMSLALVLARALGATGARGPDGLDLGTLAARGLDGLGDRAAWARLVELEERKSPASELAHALDRLLTRRDLAPALRFQALRALRAGAARALPDGALGDSAALVEWAALAGRLDELVDLLRGDAAWPGETWRDPARVPPEWDADARGALLDGWIARGDVEAAAAHLARLATIPSAPTLERALDRLARGVAAGEREVLARAFDRARNRPGVDARRMLALEAWVGLAATDDLAARVLDGLPTEGALEREDLIVLGALCAGPARAAARERLLGAVRVAGPVDDRVDALDRAVREIRGTRDESDERGFVRAVVQLAREVEPALRRRLRVDVWPAPNPGVPIRLADHDRAFARAGP